MRLLAPLVIAVAIIVGSSGCGKGEEPLKPKPQLLLDRDSLGFGQEFNSGTFIGQSPVQSLRIQNDGQQLLTLTSVTLSGDSAFMMTPPPKTMLKQREFTFVQLSFKPTEEKVYSGTLTIVSDAENAPMKTVAVTGRGIKPTPDGGG